MVPWAGLQCVIVIFHTHLFLCCFFGCIKITKAEGKLCSMFFVHCLDKEKKYV